MIADVLQQKEDNWKTWNRSNVWGLYRYMKQTRSQFDEVTDKTTTTTERFIMDEASGGNIAQYYKDEVNRIWDKAITELERVLKRNPHLRITTMAIFKSEDCSITKDSPDEIPADGSLNSTTSIAQVPSPSATVAPANPPASLGCVANPTTAVND